MAYINEYSELSPKERRQLNYKRKYKEECPNWDDSMVLLTKHFSAAVKPGARVLDYGCGRGNFVLDEMGDVFSEKVGLDVLEDSVTKNISVNQIVITKEEKLPFSDESFDTVISLWVFEHVEHPEKVFQELSRILKPGGIFAFVTPNKNSLLILIRRLMNKNIADALLKFFYGREEEDVFEVWYRTNTKNTVERLAQISGFNVKKVIENPDPSYTSFNGLTYKLSAFFSKLPLSLSKPHLITILEKK
jgi:ubiquinone/menaquinone biosynthesis C-methylase UbiE